MSSKFTALLLFTLAAAADAPRFSITSQTLDGGGGSMGDGSGRYLLTGTTGQPDAATALVSQGGRYSLQPGFWNASTILPVTGAPPLRFLPPPPATSAVILAWPASASGWSVEWSADLLTWLPLTQPVVDTAEDHTVTLNVTSTDRRLFFRMKRG